MDTNQELKMQAEKIFQGIRGIERYTSIIRALDNGLYELGCNQGAIDLDHPKAEFIKQTINDLTNLTEILLEGLGDHTERLGEMADRLNMDLLKREEVSVL